MREAVMACLSGEESRCWTVGELVERLKNLGVCATRASVTAALAELGVELELSSWAPWRLLERGTDPYERADETSNTYYDWFIYHVYILYGVYAVADKWAATFKDFPPVQHPNSFTIDEALKMLSEAGAAKH